MTVGRRHGQKIKDDADHRCGEGQCHAAAGGMGLLLSQWAKHIGAIVIGVVSSAEKAKIAQAHGCDHTIIYGEGDLVASVREITKNMGVGVVYDGVGRDTFDRSLDCLAILGQLVLYGQASGPVPPFDLARLAAKSNTITRPTLFHYTMRRRALETIAKDLFDVVRSGAVKIEVRHRYPLKDAAEAHRALEGRQTTGSVILIP